MKHRKLKSILSILLVTCMLFQFIESAITTANALYTGFCIVAPLSDTSINNGWDTHNAPSNFMNGNTRLGDDSRNNFRSYVRGGRGSYIGTNILYIPEGSYNLWIMEGGYTATGIDTTISNPNNYTYTVASGSGSVTKHKFSHGTPNFPDLTTSAYISLSNIKPGTVINVSMYMSNAQLVCGQASARIYSDGTDVTGKETEVRVGESTRITSTFNVSSKEWPGRVTYSVSNTSRATLNNGILEFKQDGMVSVTANWVSSDGYFKASATTYFEIKDPSKMVKSIAVKDYKDTYYRTDGFVNQGTIIATMEDGSIKEVPLKKEHIIAGFNTNTVGNKTLTVSYNGCKTTYDITVLWRPITLQVDVPSKDALTVFKTGVIKTTGDLDYVILPDGIHRTAEELKNNDKYKFTENGDYEFTAVGKGGDTKTVVITITNIVDSGIEDMEPPDGYEEINDNSEHETLVELIIDASKDNQGGNEPGTDPGGDKPLEDLDYYEYTITYHYDSNIEREHGYGKLGDAIPYDITSPKTFEGKNYILESYKVAEYITKHTEDNNVEIWYTLDEKDADGKDKPDGIPDKDQTDESIKDPEGTQFKYQVSYEYEDEPVGQTIRGTGLVGEVIPYIADEYRQFNNKTFMFSKLEAQSSIITPNEDKNKVNLEYTKVTNVTPGGDGDDTPDTPITNTFVVSFNPNNGEKTTTVRVNEGDTVSKITDPSKDGYEFLHWLDTDANTEYDFAQPVIGNVNLIAVYKILDTKQAYKVKYYIESGNIVDPNYTVDSEGNLVELENRNEFTGYYLIDQVEYTGDIGQTVSAVIKSYPGYTQVTNENEVLQGIIEDGTPLVLRVFYDKNDITVTFDPDNGDEVTTISVKYGSTVSRPATDPEKDGMEFDYWEENGRQVNFNNIITSDTTFKAVYREPYRDVDYIVNHFKEGLNSTGYSIADTENLTGKENTSVNAIPKTYIGFHENTSHTDREDYAVLRYGKDTELKMFYDRNIYQVTIDPDNGDSPTILEIKFGDTLNDPTHPTKPDNEFKEWVDTDGVKVDFPLEITDDITIKAKYEPTSGTGGDNPGGDKQKEYDYTVSYYYDTTVVNQTGKGKEGEEIPFSTTSKVYNGNNYCYVSHSAISSVVTSDTSKNVIDVYYELDNLGNDPTSNGDKIPDKYQVVVNFRAVNGRLSHYRVVLTKYDANNQLSVSGSARLTSSSIPTAIANYGYYRGTWDVEPVVGRAVADGQTFTITFVRMPSRPSGGGDSGGSRPRPSGGDKDKDNTSGDTTIIDTNVPLDEKVLFIKDKHIAYVYGYTNGLVGPSRNITRAEMVAIIYRLMDPTFREYYYKYTNNYKDVVGTEWFNEALSTITNAEIVSGYGDGNFGPNRNITRAEFATMISNFFNVDTVSDNNLTDISRHWAEKNINKVVTVGWMAGYPDNTFRPNAEITRAEAIHVMNKILERVITEDGLLDDMKVWPDNMDKSAWYYLDIQEATNAHEYEKVGKREIWTKLNK